MTTFSAQTYQNEYLPEGGSQVDAVVTVTASGSGGTLGSTAAAEIIIIDTSGSMDYPPAKLRAAQQATTAAVDCLRDGVSFGIIAGTKRAHQIYPAAGTLAAGLGGDATTGQDRRGGPQGQRWHRHRSLADTGQRAVRDRPGGDPSRHPAHRRQGRERDRGGPRPRPRVGPGPVPVRLPRGGHGLGGERAAQGGDQSARQRGHHRRPRRHGRRLH